MSTNFPTTIDSYTTKNNGDVIDASHVDNLQDAVTALETKVGVDTSGVAGTIDKILQNVPANKGGTGSISYTKGDILVSSASTTLTKLSVGANNTILIADSAQTTGVKWATPSFSHTRQVFTASGTWTKPAGCTFIDAEGVAGGGGSAGVNNATSAGGAAGGYSRKMIDVSAISTVTVTVGTGGTAGAAGAGHPGGTGNSTIFGVHFTALGGNGSSSAVSVTGGTASGGDVNITGGSSTTAYATAASGIGGGLGGASYFGGSGAYGSGGDGTAVSSGTGAGFAGNNGIVIVTEYYA